MGNKHIKRCSTSLVIREIYIKIPLHIHKNDCIFKKWKMTNVGKDEEKLESLNIVGGYVKWWLSPL